MARLILHAGFHKTGTSAIQQFAARNRRRLQEGGVFYPRLWPMKVRAVCAHHALAHALAEKGSGGDFERGRRLVQRWKMAAERHGWSVLLSSEAICRYGWEDSASDGEVANSYLLRWRELLRDFSVLPVLVVRRQDDFARSLYQEHVAAGVGWSASASFAEFLSGSAARKPRFLERLRGFKRVFGRVKVLAYEELDKTELPVAFFEQLDFGGIEHSRTAVVRQSLSVGETLVKQRINRWIRGRYQNRLALMWLRSRAVQRIIESELSAIDTLWPDHQVRKAFVNQFDDENAQIAAEFLDRDGMIFSPLTVDATSQAPCPADSVVDAVVAAAVRATRWRVQMLLGRQAVSELVDIGQ